MFDPSNLQIPSSVDPKALDGAINIIRKDNNLKGLGSAFLRAEKCYNVNAIILASIACLESSYGNSKLAKEKNNLFGLDARDSLMGTSEYGSAYKTKADSVDHAGHRICKQYIEKDPACTWRYLGKKDIHSVGAQWSSDKDWSKKVVDISNRIVKNIKSKGGNVMKICINPGHSASGVGVGAIGLLNESDENRKVSNELVRLLKENSNHQIIVADFNGSDNYIKAYKFANSNKVDLFVSIHFNSGANDKGGNGKSAGTETLVYSLKGAPKEATRVNANIVKLGFRDRGIKTRPDLSVLKNTSMPAMLVECCFVDDKDDVNLYNYKTMAKAIAEGILGKSISSNVPTPNPPASNGELYYRAVSGSFKGKENALDRKAKLDKAGFTGVFLDAFVKDGVTWYRVVAGSFKDKVLAEKRVADLKSKGYDGGFVTTFRK